jgi:hypothetical protein
MQPSSPRPPISSEARRCIGNLLCSVGLHRPRPSEPCPSVAVRPVHAVRVARRRIRLRHPPVSSSRHPRGLFRIVRGSSARCTNGSSPRGRRRASGSSLHSLRNRCRTQSSSRNQCGRSSSASTSVLLDRGLPCSSIRGVTALFWFPLLLLVVCSVLLVSGACYLLCCILLLALHNVAVKSHCFSSET